MKGILMMLAFALLMLAGCNGGFSGQNTGEVTFAAANSLPPSQDSELSSVEVEVEQLSVYSAEQGWVDVLDGAVLVDLKALQQSQRVVLLGDARLPEGRYSQVRAELGSPMVSQGLGDVEARIVDDELVWDFDLVVREGEASSVLLDFDVDQSVMRSSEDEYLFSPTVRVESRSGVQVNRADETNVIIAGGTIDSNAMVQ